VTKPAVYLINYLCQKLASVAGRASEFQSAKKVANGR
jgi:hypothetical protein